MFGTFAALAFAALPIHLGELDGVSSEIAQALAHETAELAQARTSMTAVVDARAWPGCPKEAQCTPQRMHDSTVRAALVLHVYVGATRTRVVLERIFLDASGQGRVETVKATLDSLEPAARRGSLRTMVASLLEPAAPAPVPEGQEDRGVPILGWLLVSAGVASAGAGLGLVVHDLKVSGKDVGQPMSIDESKQTRQSIGRRRTGSVALLAGAAVLLSAALVIVWE